VAGNISFKSRARQMSTREAVSEKTIFYYFAIGTIIIAGLYFGKALFIPLALAVFLTFLLSPAITILRHWYIPRGLAVSLVTIAAFGLMAALGFIMSRQVMNLAEELPFYQTTLIKKVKGLRDAMAPGQQLDRAAETIKTIRGELEKPAVQSPALPAAPQPMSVEIREHAATPIEQLQSVLSAAVEPLTMAGICIVFVVMLLYSREDVRDRAIRLLGVKDLERTTRAMDDAGLRLNRYFLSTTAINASFGTIIGLGLWVIGIPNPLLWGLLAMLLRFIPFIGIVLAAIVPVGLAFVIDPGWSVFAATAALFVVTEMLTSQVVETIVQGESTGLSPLAIIVATAFWTLLWGPIALPIAVPLTVVLVVLGRHVEQFTFFEILLGSEPALSSADMFYQRLLSGDPEEAADQAASKLKELPLANFYDEVAIEALKKAVDDEEAGKLDEQRVEQISETMTSFLETLDELGVPPPQSAGKAKLLASDGTAAPVRSEILCVGSRTSFDQSASDLLAHALTGSGLGTISVSPMDLAVRSGTPHDISAVKTVCLSAFELKTRLAHTKFLVKRLRRMLPAAEIVAVFWRLDASDETRLALIEEIGVDDCRTTVSGVMNLFTLKDQGDGESAGSSVELPAPPALRAPAISQV
jgi:predicted PurR-regulated permease PerM